MNVIELRNYLLKPGARDKFIEYFKDHFIVTQNLLGAYTPGQFRIKGEPDRFFWIRGFDNMQERSRFLPAFYGGEAWKEFGPAANDMMMEWHNVHLLKPVKNKVAGFDKRPGLLVIDYYTVLRGGIERLIDLFEQSYIPLYKSNGISDTSIWMSEMTVNDFAALPVYQTENLLVVITGYRSEAAFELTTDRLKYAGEKLNSRRDELVINRNTLVLYPA